MQTLGLSLHKGLDFSIYGDTIIILFQNAAVIFLIWHYNKEIPIVEKILAGAFLTAYCVILVQDTMLTDEMWGYVQNAAIAIVFLSRVPQIVAIFMEGTTGALAFATVFLGWAGSIARTSTVMIESDDFYY